ncbi:hypothetical protein [Streptomyces sp. CBMA152]|nr:hypothetical protein [Streptomyces sp. CBMA152]
MQKAGAGDTGVGLVRRWARDDVNDNLVSLGMPTGDDQVFTKSLRKNWL